MAMLQITNHGPLITATNYWDSELAHAGKLFVSVNGGAIRVLLPPQLYSYLADMRAAKECVLSRGPWGQDYACHYCGRHPYPHAGALSRHIFADHGKIISSPELQILNRDQRKQRKYSVEIMWDDGSDSPYALHLTPASFDSLPAEPVLGREWVLTVWTKKDTSPHKSLERKCHWRRVERIPCLAPWSSGLA